jgi:PKD repeat protein
MQAAEEPTSYLAGQPCDTTTNKVVCRVQLEAKGTSIAIDTADITMTCSLTGCPGQAGSSVTVGVTGEFQLLTPLLAAIFGGQEIDLAAEATAQVRYLPTFAVATAPPVPTVGFTATNVLGEAPLTVTFTDTSTGDPFAWS